MYEKADVITQRLVRVLYHEFLRLLINIDELNIVSSTNQAYKTLTSSMIEGFIELGMFMKPDITKDEIVEWLNKPSEVTFYSFLGELERQKGRLQEALEISRSKLILDKYMKQGAWLVGEFMVELTDYLNISILKQNGVKEVVWRTEDDEKVCDVCQMLDGTVFPIDEIIPKAHPNCRCYYEAYTKTEKSIIA